MPTQTTLIGGGAVNDCVHKQEIYDYHETAFVSDTFTECWSDELNFTSRGFEGLGREERLELSTFRQGLGYSGEHLLTGAL